MSPRAYTLLLLLAPLTACAQTPPPPPPSPLPDCTTVTLRAGEECQIVPMRHPVGPR